MHNAQLSSPSSDPATRSPNNSDQQNESTSATRKQQQSDLFSSIGQSHLSGLEYSYLRSAPTDKTGLPNLEHAHAALAATSVTIAPATPPEQGARYLSPADEQQHQRSTAASLGQDSPGPISELRSAAISSSLAPTESTGNVDPPWKLRSTRQSRSRSPASSSPSYLRSANYQPPPLDEQNTLKSAVAEALQQTESSSPSVHPGLNLQMHFESLISPPTTSHAAPPRSPVLSPLPKSLLPGSPKMRRDHSPSLRVGSPLAQSISPVPGFMAESGNGILSPRLSPIPSPNASPAAEIPNPLSPRATNIASLPRVDEVGYPAQPIDFGSRPSEDSDSYFGGASQDSTPTNNNSPQRHEGASAEPIIPSPIPTPQLHITSADQDYEIEDDTVLVEHDMAQMDEDQQQAMFLDDEGLTALEKIYLFSRSNFSFHRTYISKQLPYLIREVSPSEAVEYVCPLLNGLGTDAEESVKEVFVQELVPIIWWFFTHCQVIDHEQPPLESDSDIPQLPSNAFTPLIGSLLLSANPRVGDGARLAIVELLNRLQGSETNTSDDRYCPPSPLSRFGDAEKEIIINEIMNGVVLGMGRLDSEFQEGGEVPVSHSTDEGPSPGPGEYRRDETPVRDDPTPPETEQTETPPDGSILLYRAPSRRETPDRQHPSLEIRLHDPAVATAPFLDYFDSPITRERHIDADGWVTAPPQDDTEDMTAFTSQGTPHTVLNERLATQELATIEEEEPAPNDTGEEATVGRVASMSVVAAIAANATMPLHMQDVFVREVWRVGFDSVYWVRREASFAIGALAKVVPLEMVTTYLLPLYENLVRDEQWHVRHSILFALPGILARIDAEQRRLLTVPSLVQLSQDPADPVRSGLLEVLGEVIYTFRDDPGGPPRELLDLFAPREFHWSIEEPQTPGSYYDPSQNWFRDPERPIICAFNFPAVILTLGRKRWSELRDYYIFLANNPAPKVLRTLAASLGEVAAIIGSANAEKDLIPVFLSALRSSEQEVRGKIIEALPKFSESLTEGKRERLAAELSTAWPELGSWREREDLARLLGSMVSLVGKRVDTVVQIMSFAVRDEVAAVRDAAVGSVPAYLKALRGRSVLEQAENDILSLATADTYRRRVTFVACALSMVQAAESASAMDSLRIWAHLAMLVRDGIVDTRIGVARLVSTACERFYPTRRGRPRYLESLVRLLTNDENAQVRSFVSYLLDESAMASGSVTDPSSINERGFAVFSKPPRSVVRTDSSEALYGEGEAGADVEQRMSITSESPPQKGDKGSNEATVGNSEYVKMTTSSPVSATPPTLSRPQLVSIDSSETGLSGTSRGEESQASPRPTDSPRTTESPRMAEGESPKTRTSRLRRGFVMTLSDLPNSGDLTPEGIQSVTITLTPSPGSERRISFDALSTHSDGSDSSGRMDPIPLVRRASLHRISSDPSVSVASG